MNNDHFKEKNITTVIFDLDNTLSDRKYSFSCHAKRLAEMYLKDRPAAEGQAFSDLLIKLDNNGYADKKKVYSEVCRSFGLEGREREMSAEWDISASMFCRREQYAEEILGYLGGKYTLALLTNGLSKTQNIKLDGVGLRHFFADVMISEDTGTAKPDREIYLMMCSRLGCLPENALYIGDHPENDYYGPVSAGLNALLYDRYSCCGEDIPKISSLSELRVIL